MTPQYFENEATSQIETFYQPYANTMPTRNDVSNLDADEQYVSHSNYYEDRNLPRDSYPTYDTTTTYNDVSPSPYQQTVFSSEVNNDESPTTRDSALEGLFASTPCTTAFFNLTMHLL
jgi:hypothetical protein